MKLKNNNSRWATDQYNIAADLGIALSLGEVGGAWIEQPRGHNLDVDNADGDEIVAQLAYANAVWPLLGVTAAQQYGVNTDTTNTGEGHDKIRVTHLDANWALRTDDITVADDTTHNLPVTSRRFLKAVALTDNATDVLQSNWNITRAGTDEFQIVGGIVDESTAQGALSRGGGKSNGVFYTTPISHRAAVLSGFIKAHPATAVSGVAHILATRDMSSGGGEYVLDVVAEIPFSNTQPGFFDPKIAPLIEQCSDVFMVITDLSTTNIKVYGGMDLLVFND